MPTNLVRDVTTINFNRGTLLKTPARKKPPARKKLFQRSKTPLGFLTTLQEPSPYQHIRLSERDAPAWLTTVFAELQSPTSMLAKAFNDFGTFQESFTAQLQSKPWAEVTSWELVTWMHIIAGIHEGAEEFLPRSVRGLTPLHAGTTFVCFQCLHRMSALFPPSALQTLEQKLK